MLQYIAGNRIGHRKQGDYDNYFYFSYAEYFDIKRMGFGDIKLFNDLVLLPGMSMEFDSQKNIEVITYVMDGKLEQSGDIIPKTSLSSGQFSYLGAGSGVSYKKYNRTKLPARFLDIWIMPDNNNTEPVFNQSKPTFQDRKDRWLHLNKDIKMQVEVELYAVVLTEGKNISTRMNVNRKAFLVLLEGEAQVENIRLNKHDALEVSEQNIQIYATKTSHMFVAICPTG